MTKVICAGHICVDLTPSIPDRGVGFADIFVGGKQTEVEDLEISTGGGASNTGAALSRMGFDTSIMGRIGDDILADLIPGLLAELGTLDNYLSIAPNEGSSYSVVISVPGEDRVFLHAPAVNDTFTADDVNYDKVSNADLFHFGYPPLMKQMYINDGHALTELMKRTKELGVTTSLDTAYPDPTSSAANRDWNLIFENVLPYTDIFSPSVEEILLMSERDLYDELAAKEGDILGNITIDTIERIADRMIGFGAKVVMIKCSTHGIYLKTADESAIKQMGRATPNNPAAWANKELFTGIYSVDEVKSSTGAGDCSIAGMLAALIKNAEPEQAITMAVAAGAYNVTATSAAGGIVPFEEMEKKVLGGWKKNDPGIELDGYSYDKDHAIYCK